MHPTRGHELHRRFRGGLGSSDSIGDDRNQRHDQQHGHHGPAVRSAWRPQGSSRESREISNSRSIRQQSIPLGSRASSTCITSIACRRRGNASPGPQSAGRDGRQRQLHRRLGILARQRCLDSRIPQIPETYGIYYPAIPRRWHSADDGLRPSGESDDHRYRHFPRSGHRPSALYARAIGALRRRSGQSDDRHGRGRRLT